LRCNRQSTDVLEADSNEARRIKALVVVAVPILRVSARVLLEKGRGWSAVDELVLWRYRNARAQQVNYLTRPTYQGESSWRSFFG